MQLRMYISSQRKKGERGFTLVETLVAVLILMMVIIGPMTIASRGIQGSYFANEQVTAVFLAQEAMESIQQLRDDNALEVFEGGSTESWEWYDDLESSCKNTGANGGCDYNILMGTYHSCATESNCKLEMYTGSAEAIKYGYGNLPDWNTNSPYTRKIQIGTEVGGGVPVMVTVSWTSHLFSSSVREVTLQTWIYDQYSRFE